MLALLAHSFSDGVSLHSGVTFPYSSRLTSGLFFPSIVEGLVVVFIDFRYLDILVKQAYPGNFEVRSRSRHSSGCPSHLGFPVGTGNVTRTMWQSQISSGDEYAPSKHDPLCGVNSLRATLGLAKTLRPAVVNCVEGSPEHAVEAFENGLFLLSQCKRGVVRLVAATGLCV